MKFTDIAMSIVSQWKHTNRVVPYIEGKPGEGKSALGVVVAKQMGIADANVHQFFASLKEPVDLMGTPSQVDDVTRWFPPEELAALATGRHLLILEELSDALVPMQNALCGLIHDRKLGALKLSDECFIMATGNRTKDKSGANRIVSKLGGRVRRFEFEANLEDWKLWALTNGVDPMGVAFLSFRPDLLSSFTPDNFSSPTPRTWEKAFMVPTTLPEHVYLETLAGDVGQPAAIEFVAFRRTADRIPDIDACIANPKGCDIPQDPATLYAMIGALSHAATKDNFEAIATIGKRLSPEFRTMLVQDARRVRPEINKTPAFTRWAVENADLFYG